MKNATKYEDRFRNFMDYPRNESEVLYLQSETNKEIYFLGNEWH